MYDSEFIKKTHRNRGKKIFSPPSSVCLKEKESKFARETSALTQSPCDGKSTSINPAEMQRELLVVCHVLISSCAQRKSKVSQYQTSLQWTKLACFQQISWLSSLESAETLLPLNTPIQNGAAKSNFSVWDCSFCKWCQQELSRRVLFVYFFPSWV